MTEQGVFTVEMSCDYYEPMSVKSAWSDESLARNHAEELATEHAEWFTIIEVRKWDLGRSESIKVIYGR